MSIITASLPSKTTLTTLPPELLLSILSHLPTNNFHTLSFVSHSLQSFLHIHAATICNTLITSHSTYSLAATILQAQYSTTTDVDHDPDDEKIHEKASTGWLLPTHRCVIAAETRIVRDRILSSGCHCTSCVTILRSPSSSSSLSLELSFGLGGLFCLPISAIARRRDEGCTAGEGNLTRLSTPGPAFLVFLEKYAWDVVARWEMSGSSTSTSTAPGSPISPTSQQGLIVVTTSSTGEGNADGDSPNQGQDQEKRREKEERFSFMVGNYCVRRFLEDISHNTRQIQGFHSDAITPPSSDYQSWIRIKKQCRELRARFGNLSCLNRRRKEKAPEGQRPQRMMFGEIPSDDTLPVQLETEKEEEKRKPRVEGWMRGLVWWYAPVPPMSTPVGADSKPEEKEVDSGKKRGCMSSLKVGKARAKGKIIQAWSRLGRRSQALNRGEGEGEFQSLDD